MDNYNYFKLIPIELIEIIISKTQDYTGVVDYFINFNQLNWNTIINYKYPYFNKFIDDNYELHNINTYTQLVDLEYNNHNKFLLDIIKYGKIAEIYTDQYLNIIKNKDNQDYDFICMLLDFILKYKYPSLFDLIKNYKLFNKFDCCISYALLLYLNIINGMISILLNNYKKIILNFVNTGHVLSSDKLIYDFNTRNYHSLLSNIDEEHSPKLAFNLLLTLILLDDNLNHEINNINYLLDTIISSYMNDDNMYILINLLENKYHNNLLDLFM